MVTVSHQNWVPTAIIVSSYPNTSSNYRLTHVEGHRSGVPVGYVIALNFRQILI